jgi:hypothetical protein
MREFSLDKILTVTTGRLVTRNRMDGLYDIMDYMTGEYGITTIGLLSASDVCKTALLEQYPALASIEDPDFPTPCTEEVIEEWLNEQEAVFGKSLPVSPIVNYVPESDISAFMRIRNGG